MKAIEKKNQHVVTELSENFTAFEQIQVNEKFTNMFVGEYFLATFKGFRCFFQKKMADIALEPSAAKTPRLVQVKYTYSEMYKHANYNVLALAPKGLLLASIFSRCDVFTDYFL
jgi:hypothetical protein